MSYQLNKTDGTLLTSLIDGQIDTNSTNLTLVGKNYTGYGEVVTSKEVTRSEHWISLKTEDQDVQLYYWPRNLVLRIL